MCNLYSETKGQAAIRGLFRVEHDRTGNLPSFPAIFPDQMAPIVRNAEDGNRELVHARWGMPGPVQYGGGGGVYAGAGDCASGGGATSQQTRAARR